LLQDVGADEERLRSALKKIDAHVGAEALSGLGQRIGNTAVHRVLTHAAAVDSKNAVISITFAGGANESALSEKSRKVLEAILRAANLDCAVVVRTGAADRSAKLDVFEVAPSSVGDQAAFVRAAEAEVGNLVARFLMPPKAPAFHFEIKK
jgi:hypothetical protein